MILKTIGPTGALIQGKESRSLAVVTPTTCSKAREKGPCKFCSFHSRGLSPLPIAQILDEFKDIFREERNKPPHTGRVELISNGSLLDDGLPFEALLEILGMVRKNHYTEVVVEGRPEHLTKERLVALKEAAGNTFLRFAFGLESWNEYIRNTLLGKDISKEEVLRVMDLLRTHGVGAWLYTLLKPLSLNEKEAVKDCINTIRSCSLKFPDLDIVFALQPAFIAEGSEYARRAYAENYLPPFLWSIVEFLRRIHSPEFIRSIRRERVPQIFIGLSDEQLAHGNYVKNCPECSDQIYHLIDEEYNRTQDLHVFDRVACECEKDWREVFEERKIETYQNTTGAFNLEKLRQ